MPKHLEVQEIEKQISDLLHPIIPDQSRYTFMIVLSVVMRQDEKIGAEFVRLMQKWMTNS